VVRADREVTAPVDADTEARLRVRLREALPACGAVVVSDYDKGAVTPALTRFVLSAARRAGRPVLVDPKVGHFRQYRRAALVTPNQGEAEQATGIRIRTSDDLAEAGRRLLSQLACDAALITRGEQGMSLFRRGRRVLNIPTAAQEVFDVTGAGDTVIATLGLALAARADLALAARLANLAAGVVVGKLGTATASPAEVLAALDASGA
jgi:D-beta-D-heptose 7-phosphate kinase/D-beta-D-heptose 1-phosphate adenosyltransferase